MAEQSLADRRALSIYHWAFFCLVPHAGGLQLAKREQMRVFVIVSAVVVYVLFLAVAVTLMSGFERVLTVVVCCCAPVIVYAVTTTFGADANRLLDERMLRANRQLEECIGPGDNRSGLAVVQLVSTFGRSEAVEKVTFLVRGYEPRPPSDPKVFVDLAELFARDQVVLALSGSARSFQPLLAHCASWPTPVPMFKPPGRYRIEAPFILL